MTKSFENGAARRLGLPWTRRVPHRRVLLVAGILTLFNLVFYLAAVMPLDARSRQQQAEAAALTEQVKTQTAEVEKLRAIVGKIEKARPEGDALLAAITLERNTTFSTLVAELDEAATASGIETRESTYDLDSLEGTEEYGTIMITANYRGEYENLVRFLNRLDRSRHFLIIESLNALPRSDSSGLQITMRIDTFLRDL